MIMDYGVGVTVVVLGLGLGQSKALDSDKAIGKKEWKVNRSMEGGITLEVCKSVGSLLGFERSTIDG
jgi:hypothetical protein